MKFLQKKWFKRTIVVAITLLFFIAGLALTYFTVPSRTNTINLGSPTTQEPLEETTFSKFVSRLSPLLQGGQTDEAFCLNASFDDLTIEWPSNRITLDGEINVSVSSLEDLDFNLDVDANYNDQTIDLGLGFVDDTLYVATKDLKLKQSFVTDETINKDFVELINHAKELFNVDNGGDKVDIELDLTSLLGELLGIDISAITENINDLISENTVENTDFVTVSLPMGEETLEICLELDVETASLTKVDLGTIHIGDATISGILNCVSNSDVKVYGLDDERYTFRKRTGFVDIVNYGSWLDSAFTLLNTKSFGLDFNAKISASEDKRYVIGGSIDTDASRYEPLNIIDTVIGIIINSNIKTKSFRATSSIDISNIINVLNDFDINANVEFESISKKDEIEVLNEYINLDLSYFKNILEENAGYLSLNNSNKESLMKAKIDVDTINYLVAQIPELIESITGKNAIENVTGDDLADIFTFITSSELVNAIKNGKYDGIIEMIKEIKNDQKTMQISIDLSKLGFGENSQVDIILNAGYKSEGLPTNVISINFINAKIGSVNVDLSLNTRQCAKSKFEAINSVESSYCNLNFLPGMLDQVQDIINTKQTGFTVSGSAKDDAGLGFDMDGWAQLDYGEQYGFGHIEFDEYKYDAETMQTPHTVDLLVENFDGNHATNNMKFEYRDKLRGRFTLKTFDDIIDLVTKLIENPDTRFTKFFKPLLDSVVECALVQVIEDGEFSEQLLSPSIIKSASHDAEGKFVDIVISKDLLMSLDDSDVEIKVNFRASATEKRELDSIEIINLKALNKTINLRIGLQKFDANKEVPLDLSEGVVYNDFSDIAVLLEFGINTSELTVFHLTANLGLKLNILGFLDLPLVNVNLDFYIYVDGEETRVYGKMPSNPILGFNNSAEFLYEPIMNEKGESVGGYFHILKTCSPTLTSWSRNNQVYYHADGKNLVDNILVYILSGMLDIGESTVKGIGNLSTNSEGKKKDPKYENTLTDTGFVYHSDGLYWDVGVSIEALTELTSISPIEGTIYGKNVNGVGYLSKVNASTNLLNTLPVQAEINLVDPNPTVKEWPTEITNRYNAIISFYHTLSDEVAASFNNSTSGYTFSGRNI